MLKRAITDLFAHSFKFQVQLFIIGTQIKADSISLL